MRKKNWKTYYPLLFGIYPVLGLLAVNISQMTLLSGLRSILVSIVFSVTSYAVFCWRIRDEHKAALLCTWFLVFFFAYGHVYDTVEGWSVFGFVLGRHRFLFPFWVTVFGFGAWLIFKSCSHGNSTTRTMNIISVILMIIPIVQITVFEWQRHNPVPINNGQAESIQDHSTSATGKLPDIYYIILDGYARDDILLRNYKLDISGFIGQLEEIGFHVLPCSQSNYGITDFSLVSSLNMDYVNKVAPPAVEKQKKWVALAEPIKHSRVRLFFEDLGYRTVSIENGIWWSEWTDADYYLQGNYPAFESSLNFWQPNDFEILYLRTTVFQLFEGASNVWFGLLFDAPKRRHAERILFTLDQLEEVPLLPGPKFVFVHLVAPHEPYVFSPDGDFIISRSAKPGYSNEIQYLNKRLIPLMQNIIVNSSLPPIVILQADHGRDPEVRVAIFNAVYFPNGGDATLYPTLSPVNIFRLVLNSYFGQDLPLLPDISYYSRYGNYYDFTEVTYPCDPGRQLK